MTPTHLVGAIVYEPDSAEVVAAVCGQLRALAADPVVIDNSTSPGATELVRAQCRRSGVELIGDGTNRGTACGINRLLEIAAERGRDWLTYFDQDSRLLGDYAARLPSLATIDPDVAGVGSVFDEAGAPPEPEPCREARYLIASGTSWRVAAVVGAGGCDEEMFLDVVDIELCLRLRAHGWRLLVDPARAMVHHIGADRLRIAGPVTASRHPAWRRRLMWRNSIVLARRYAGRFPGEVMRHLLVRVVETIGGAVRYRRPRLLWWALLGAGDGLRAPSGGPEPTGGSPPP